MILSPFTFQELTALMFDLWFVSFIWILVIGVAAGLGKFLIGNDDNEQTKGKRR